MIDIYLPIADLRADVFVLLLIGLTTGILSGIFGLGGGLISVPMLTIIGIPPQTAVITATNQMTAGTLSACIAYAKRNKVDFKLGAIMLAGGVIGNVFGIFVFEYLQSLGTVDSFISISFFILLVIICLRSIFQIYKDYKKSRPDYVKPNIKKTYLLSKLPLQTNFASIRHQASILVPFTIGIMGGFFIILLGIGGGFIMIPTMLFVFKMNSEYISGTIQFQIIFTSILSTFLHSFNIQHIDIILAIFLITGTVLGAQIGARIGLKINPKKFRFILILIILVMAISIGKKLFLTPDNLFVIKELAS